MSALRWATFVVGAVSLAAMYLYLIALPVWMTLTEWGTSVRPAELDEDEEWELVDIDLATVPWMDKHFEVRSE